LQFGGLSPTTWSVKTNPPSRASAQSNHLSLICNLPTIYYPHDPTQVSSSFAIERVSSEKSDFLVYPTNFQHDTVLMLPFNSPTSTPPRMKNRKPKESMSFEQSGSRCHATNLPDSWNRDPITQNLDSSSWWACTTRGLRTVQPPCISICDGQRRHLRSGYRTPPRDKQNFNHEENLREA
jgi:hypothetical protein